MPDEHDSRGNTACAVSSKKDKKAKGCFINQLPLELLEHIFVTATQLELLPYVTTPVIIMRVCRLWNRVAMSSPGLWSTYHPGPLELPFSREILARSGGHPLTLGLFTFALKDSSGLEDTLEVFIELSHRWKSLDLYIFDHMAPAFISALSRTTGELKTLKIDVNDCYESNVGLITEAIVEHCQSLRHLEYRCTGLYSRVFLQLPWDRLSTLLISTSITIDEGRYILSSCTSATSVDLRTIKNRRSSIEDWDPSAVHILPSLNSLRLGVAGVDPADILASFTMPKLRKLELQCAKSTLADVSAFHNFLVDSKCTLDSFILRDNGFTKDPLLVAQLLMLNPLQDATILEFRLRLSFRVISEAVKKSLAGKQSSLRLRAFGPGIPGVHVNRTLDARRPAYY